MPKAFFKDSDGLTGAFDQISAGISGPKLRTPRSHNLSFGGLGFDPVVTKPARILLTSFPPISCWSLRSRPGLAETPMLTQMLKVVVVRY